MNALKFAVQQPPTYKALVVRGPKGDKGDEGASGTSEIGATTATDLVGLLYGDGNTVSSLDAVSGRAFLDAFSQSETQAAITAALGAYTPTSGLAAIATSGNAADLFGTLPNSRLSAQVVRNDFSYADPSWITSIAATKITGSFVNITATGNGSITGTLQIGGAAGHLLRWNSGASSLEVRDSGNSFYRKTRLGELQIISDTGGNFGTPSNARLGFLTQVGGYIAGAISGRTYSGSAIYGDIVLSASPAIGTGQNDYSGLTDDLAIRGNTGNVEINRGLLSIGMAGQTARSLSILPVNTGDRTGVRVYDYGSFASASTQSSFEVTYLGGTFAAPSTTVSGHYRNLLSFRTGGATGVLSNVPSFAIRSTIGSVIGSSLSEVNTSMMVTSTATGLTIPVQTMFGNTGLVDFPVGQIQLGTNVRLKHVSGDLHIRNSGDTDFGGIAASTGNFSNIVYANNGVRVSGSAGMQFSSATPVPGSGSLPWLIYTANSNTLFTRDANNARMFLTMTGGANSSSSNLQIHANAYVESSLFLSGGGGAVFASATPAVVGGSHPWLMYTANSSVLYIRDATNGRMHVTYTQGASAAAALTQFHSRLSLDAAASHTEVVMTPTGTTQSMTCDSGNMQTLNLGSATGTVALTITPPTTGSATVRLLILQGTTPRNITFAITSGSIVWLGTQQDWVGMGANKSIAVACIWNGSVMRLAASEVST